MKKLPAILLVSCVTIIITSCFKTDSCRTDPSKRKGAICKDGTITSKSDSTACNAFGGVHEWICE